MYGDNCVWRGVIDLFGMTKMQIEKLKEGIKNMSSEELKEVYEILRPKYEDDVPPEAMERLMGELDNPPAPPPSAVNSLRECLSYDISDTMERTLRAIHKKNLGHGTIEQLKYVLNTTEKREEYLERIMRIAIKNAKSVCQFENNILGGRTTLKEFVETYAWEEIEEAYDAELCKVPINKICETLNPQRENEL